MENKPSKQHFINYWSGREGDQYYDAQGNRISEEEYQKQIAEAIDYREASDAELQEIEMRLEVELFRVKAELDKRGFE